MTPSPPHERLHLIVQGVVQGVGFRWFTARVAVRCQLHGFVRNLPDGSVEVCAEGVPEAIAVLRRAVAEGPEGARVERVTAAPAPDDGALPYPFEIRR